jgi:hypothetical protein
MNPNRSRPELAYSRPTAWVPDATLDDTRAFAERCRRAWPACREALEASEREGAEIISEIMSARL